jgi:antitoxin CcdA
MRVLDLRKTARETIMDGRDSHTSRRPVKFTIEAELLDKARRLKIDLSRTLEDRLTQLVREAEAEAWLAANRKAIDAYNARVKRDGVWSDKLRGF